MRLPPALETAVLKCRTNGFTLTGERLPSCNVKRSTAEPSPRRTQLRTRPPLDRMQRIFHSIRQGHYPSRLKLAQEIEVTTKTIQRDIDFMRDRWSMPIAYNGERHGYEMTESVESFPMVELTEAELISVFVAQKALCQYRGTPV